MAPRSKFLGEHVVILNFRLESLDDDAADVGGILGSFAAAFFGGAAKNLLIVENVKFDLDKNPLGHKRRIGRIVKKLREAQAMYVPRT